MSISITTPRRPAIVYPDSDGKPIAENTLQFEWIVTIKEGLDRAFHDRPDVFVAGDLFWYPVEGRPDICTAPDALVAIGRPKGHRGSYKQWEEDGIAPQVVFEVLPLPPRDRQLAASLWASTTGSASNGLSRWSGSVLSCTRRVVRPTKKVREPATSRL